MTRRRLRLIGLAIGASLILTSLGGFHRPVSADVILGDSTIAPGTDTDAAGHAEAFQVTAGSTSSVSVLNVYVDSSSAASTLVAGLYSDNAGHPGTLLAQGSMSAPVAGTWNAVPIPPTTVNSGGDVLDRSLGGRRRGNACVP